MPRYQQPPALPPALGAPTAPTIRTYSVSTTTTTRPIPPFLQRLIDIYNKDPTPERRRVLEAIAKRLGIDLTFPEPSPFPSPFERMIISKLPPPLPTVQTPQYITELGLSSQFQDIISDAQSGRITPEQANREINIIFHEKIKSWDNFQQYAFLMRHPELTNKDFKTALLLAKQFLDDYLAGRLSSVMETSLGAFLEKAIPIGGLIGREDTYFTMGQLKAYYQNPRLLFPDIPSDKITEVKKKIYDRMLMLSLQNEFGQKDMLSYLLSFPSVLYATSAGITSALSVAPPVVQGVVGSYFTGQTVGSLYTGYKTGTLRQTLLSFSPAILGGSAGLRSTPPAIRTTLSTTFPKLYNFSVTGSLSSYIPSALKQAYYNIRYAPQLIYQKLTGAKYIPPTAVFEPATLSGEQMYSKIKTGPDIATRMIAEYKPLTGTTTVPITHETNVPLSRPTMRQRVTAIIETTRGTLLVSHGGDYMLPGGAANKGESWTSALKREVYEETGLKVTDSTYLYSVPDYSSGNLYHVFRTTTTGTPKLMGESTGFKYYKSGTLSTVSNTFDSAFSYIKSKPNIKHVVIDFDETIGVRYYDIRSRLIDVKALPGAIEFIRRLKSEGYDVSVWSHGNQAEINKAISILNIKHYLKEVIGDSKSNTSLKDIRKIQGDILIDNLQNQVSLVKGIGKEGFTVDYGTTNMAWHVDKIVSKYVSKDFTTTGFGSPLYRKSYPAETFTGMPSGPKVRAPGMYWTPASKTGVFRLLQRQPKAGEYTYGWSPYKPSIILSSLEQSRILRAPANVRYSPKKFSEYLIKLHGEKPTGYLIPETERATFSGGKTEIQLFTPSVGLKKLSQPDILSTIKGYKYYTRLKGRPIPIREYSLFSLENTILSKTELASLKKSTSKAETYAKDLEEYYSKPYKYPFTKYTGTPYKESYRYSPSESRYPFPYEKPTTSIPIVSYKYNYKTDYYTTYPTRQEPPKYKTEYYPKSTPYYKPTISPPPKRKLPEQPSEPSKYSQTGASYNVYIKKDATKRTKHWQKANDSPLDFQSAAGLGILRAKNTASRTFRLEHASGEATHNETYASAWSNYRYQFYEKVGKSLTYIQRTQYSISTVGEKQEITFAPRYKPRTYKPKKMII